MPFLNYHHLVYFWNVAREGGVAQGRRETAPVRPDDLAARGSASSRKSSATEASTHRGRTLVLTEVGRLVYQYAGDILSRSAASCWRPSSSGRILGRAS